jgi:hypothetical protein
MVGGDSLGDELNTNCLAAAGENGATVRDDVELTNRPCAVVDTPCKAQWDFTRVGECEVLCVTASGPLVAQAVLGSS